MHRPSSRRVNEKDKRVTSESQHFDPSIDNREVKRTDLGKIRGVNLDDVKKFVGVSFRSFLLPVLLMNYCHKNENYDLIDRYPHYIEG